MKDAEKRELIRRWWKEGRIKRLGSGSYSIPSEAFVKGITPRLVAEVLKQER